MLNKYRITALIPARGGSKRLPRKNVKILCGKPLISWTIEAAKKSKYIDNVIVSTDDLEIKEISEQWGAQVPFLRPDYLSSDTASSFDVIKHAIEFLKINDENHLLILLQPTSPLRTFEQIDEALEYFFKKQAEGIVSISECEHSPLWSNSLPENLSMENFIRPEIIGKRSQDLPNYYRLNGSIYIYKTKSLLKENKIFYNKQVFGFKISKESSIDIDNESDFKLAQLILDGYSIDE